MEPSKNKSWNEQEFKVSGFICFAFRHKVEPTEGQKKTLQKFVWDVCQKNLWIGPNGNANPPYVEGIHSFPSDVKPPIFNCDPRFLVEVYIGRDLKATQFQAFSKYMSKIAEELTRTDIHRVRTVGFRVIIMSPLSDFDTPAQICRDKVFKEGSELLHQHREKCYGAGKGCTYTSDAYGIYWSYCEEGKKLEYEAVAVL